LNITAKFQIKNDRVSVEIPEKNVSTHKPNVVFFDSQNNQIVDIGESEETIRNNVLKYEKEFPAHLIIGKSFQYDDEKSGFFDLMVVEFYLWSLYYGKKKLPIALEAIDFDFYIPDYEKWPEQRKVRFEYSLMADYKARHLVINSVSKDVPVEKRQVEKTLRIFLTVVLPLVMFYGGIAFTESIQDFMLVFLISFVSIVAGIIVWALIAKTLLPKPYLAFILPKLPYASWIQKLGKYFLDIQPQK
jgi:hypothetical protein